MTCTYCKAENTEDCLYCPNCGKPAAAAVEPISLPIPPPSTKAHVVVNPIIADQSLSTNQIPGADSAQTPAPASSPQIADMPGPQNTQLAQANLLRLRRNWSDATDLCIAVLREAPADPAAHSLLGDIYRDQNRLDEAVRWYRMALELSPNPFDQANLQKAERQIAGRDLAYGAGSPGADQQGAFNPVTGSLADSAPALMGVAPQKWLRGITVSALAFLCLFVIYLIMIPARSISNVPRSISSGAQVSDTQIGSNGMPPAVLGGPTSLPAGEQSAPPNPSVSRVAGTGLPPDLGSTTVQPMQPQAGSGGTVGAGVGPAPVRSGSGTSAAAVASGQVGVLSQSQAGTHSNSLTGGIQAGPVAASGGSATIQLISSNASASREVLVRNAFRAARTVFANDITLQRASVTVYADSVDGSSLLSADIDRGPALAADPDGEDLASLIGRMRLH